jgi:hypothetical protein
MPKIPTVLADKASLGRPALPRDFGGGEGMEALGQAVGGIGDIAGKLFEEEMSAQVSGSLGEATRALNDLNLEVQANPDHNARDKMYADGAAKIAAEFREGLRYPKFQGMFDERLEGSLERGRVGIAQGVRQAQVDAAKAGRMTFIESQVDALENISNPTERVQTLNGIREEIQAGVRGGLWSAEQAAAMQINIEDRVAKKEMVTQAQVAADGLRQSIPDPQERVDAARSRYRGGLRSQVVALVEHQIATDQTLSDRARSKRREQIYHEIKAGKHTAQSILEISADEDFGQSETEAWLELLMPTTAQRDLASRVIYDGLLDLAVTPGPEQRQFFEMDFFSPRPGPDAEPGTEDDLPPIAAVAGSHLDKLVALQKAGPESKEVLHGDRTRREVKGLLVRLGLPDLGSEAGREAATPETLLEIQQVERTLEDFFSRKMEEEKRPWLYPEELRDIVDNLADEQVLTHYRPFPVEYLHSNEMVRRYEVTPELVGQDIHGDPPHHIEAEIREAYGLGDSKEAAALETVRDVYRQSLLDWGRGGEWRWPEAP